MADRAPRDIQLRILQPLLIQHAKDGDAFFLKFTCGKCGLRLMVEEPNVMYTEGICDHCGYVTDLMKTGAGYALLKPTSAEGRQEVQNMVARSRAGMEIVYHPSGYMHTPGMTLFCSECAARN